MKTPIFLFVLSLFSPSVHLWAEPIVSPIDTIELKFDETVVPPACIFPYQKIARPKIGLALSGGGLRGVAQIGVLKVLVENDIPIDYIVGSSIGAIIGGLFSSGYTPDDIWNIIRSLDWNELLYDTPKRSTLFWGQKQTYARAIVQFRLDRFMPLLPEALTPGHSISEILTDILLQAPFHAQNFENLSPPLRIISTDLLSGKKIVLNSGDLAEAMRASAAIPLLLSAVEHSGMLLADGGIVDNIPVIETKNFGADVVIAVNTSSPLRDRSELQAPWEMADQVTTIMQQSANADQLERADIVIDFRDVEGTNTDTRQAEYLYSVSQRRTLQRLAEIRKILSLKRESERDETYPIHRVIVKNIDDMPELEHLRALRRGIISRNEVLQTLRQVYGTGEMIDARAVLYSDGGDTCLQYEFKRMPFLRDVIFHGQARLPDSALKRQVQPLCGKPINFFSSRRVLKEIIQLYRNNGFSLARITDIDYDRENENAHIYIDEGIISSISYSGIDKTRRYVIDRELSLERGRVFLFDQARLGVKNVYGTGLFKTVTLKAVQTKKENLIDIHLEEKPSFIFRAGAHYDRDRHGNLFLELADENFFGTSNDFTLFGKYGDRDREGSIDFRADRIFKSYLTSEIDIHDRLSDYYAYDNFKKVGEYSRRSTGAVFRMGRQIERFGTISGIMRTERIDIETISGYGYDTGSLFLNTVGFNLFVDTRDQVPFSKSGRFHKFLYEGSSGDFLGADISYFKVQNQLSTFLTMADRHTLNPRFDWGTSDLTTPFSEQFRLGGLNSFYGLREGEMQGRHMVLFSIEYRYLLIKKALYELYLAARYDIGAVWENAVDIKATDFQNGKGVAVSIKTPLGPATIAYGLSSTGGKRFYFSLGYPF